MLASLSLLSRACLLYGDFTANTRRLGPCKRTADDDGRVDARLSEKANGFVVREDFIGNKRH